MCFKFQIAKPNLFEYLKVVPLTTFVPILITDEQLLYVKKRSNNIVAVLCVASESKASIIRIFS